VRDENNMRVHCPDFVRANSSRYKNLINENIFVKKIF
jgi:hypothetical protein